VLKAMEALADRPNADVVPVPGGSNQ